MGFSSKFYSISCDLTFSLERERKSTMWFISSLLLFFTLSTSTPLLIIHKTQHHAQHFYCLSRNCNSTRKIFLIPRKLVREREQREENSNKKYNKIYYIRNFSFFRHFVSKKSFMFRRVVRIIAVLIVNRVHIHTLTLSI